MKSNKEWIHWGRTDPMWAVATWEGRQKNGINPWTDEEFYALGTSDWADFSPHWKSFGWNTRHCVEIGCGAGRMTKPMASTFEHVSGLDVSQDQVAFAEQHVKAANVSFYVTNGNSIPVTGVTAVFSTHVFQHFNDLSDADAMLKCAAKALIAGGSMMLHMPIHSLPRSKVRPLFQMLAKTTNQVALGWAVARRKLGVPLMRGLFFDQDWLVSKLAAAGFRDVEFRTFRTTASGGWHSFVFAKK
jgi:2-polyprenyl-3-methyl-5-hydroxy-6-metoxy-1,4-benzoquinol methylase